MDKEPRSAGKANLFKDYLIIVLIAVIGTAVTIIVFVRLFSVSRQSIRNMWYAETLSMSHDIEYYLSVPRDAVLFASKGVEDMMESGASNAEINAYLIDETAVYSALIDSNNTGIYCYINGEYLDSSGWVPPEGYDATKRPWYEGAVKADGEITFVGPYVNAQTDELMMSVAKLLSDKESVISMDIFLDSIQRIDQQMLENSKIQVAMVISSEGFVVSHSDKKEIGKNYKIGSTPFNSQLYSRVISAEGESFTLTDNGVKKIIFSKPLNEEWYSVFVLNEKEVFSSIIFIHINYILVMAMVFTSFWLAFRIFRKRHLETNRLTSELSAIADIYLSVSILDIDKLKLNKMWVSEKLQKILSAGHFSLERVDEIVQAIAAESSRNMLEQFMDFSSLRERLSNSKSISHDFLDIDNHWTRMHFIAGAKDSNGRLTHVIWATESIDEDKRRQEALRKKAETDSLTKILNRSGGEARLFNAFEKGKKGMLLLIDADHFKYVNDNFGHDVGDKVIIAIANCLSETFRDSDIVYRLGGDEFSVFASGVMDTDIGRIVADRLFMNLARVDIPELGDWKIYLSVGATFCDPGKGSSFADLYKQADTAMYESKQRSGNYITFYYDK